MRVERHKEAPLVGRRLQWNDHRGLALLQKDKAFAIRYLAGEADAVRKFTRLHEVAFAGE